MSNALQQAAQLGQSIWYDNIRRNLITSGELQQLVDDGVLGVTSNPAIFKAALVGSPDYDADMERLASRGGLSAQDIYEQLAVADIQLAADVLRPVYDRTKGRDGYISFEVSPYLANDREATVAEAIRLRDTVARDNVLIKIPATAAGIEAIEEVISRGISVNVTLLFSVDQYEQVANAYMSGLEKYARAGGDLKKVASVASFFISRIDTLIDQQLSDALDQTRDEAKRARLKPLLGKVAIANAVVAYALYLDISRSRRWKQLEDKGANPQRLLWASTGTKNDQYSKTLYVEKLLAPETVNTVPTETLLEVQKLNALQGSITDGWPRELTESKRVLSELADLGVSLESATETLLQDALDKFCDPFDQILSSVETKRQSLNALSTAQTESLGTAKSDLDKRLKDWRLGGKVRRLWKGDPQLWSGADEGRWVGWLHLPEKAHDAVGKLERLSQEVQSAGFTDAVVLGMGGSSLCPEVLAQTFGRQTGAPRLHVLDSTVPEQIRNLEQQLDISRTVFIVSSKSGSTIEPIVFQQYFVDKVRAQGDSEQASERFIAVTDPKTKMHAMAKQDRFRHIFLGLPDVGGRFSALSMFGLVPAAVMGLDIERLLERTDVMVQACSSCVPPEQNPGVRLGLALATLVSQGRNKLTIVASPPLAAFGSWLEQLIAESTGKQGKGLVPIDGEAIGAPGVYGSDRIFVYARLRTDADPKQDAAITALEKAGHPVIRIELNDAWDVGQEFFRWEVATAVVGAELGINPFDQPDVEAAKNAARELTTAYESSGSLPEEKVLCSQGGLSVFADPFNLDQLGNSVSGEHTVEGYLRAHLQRLAPGDYFAINAYLDRCPENDTELQSLRSSVRDRRKVATTLGYGPRFLHSTGQLHKGGPNEGVFLQIIAGNTDDVSIPRQKLTFGVLSRAQAQGDFQVLSQRRRRILGIRLDKDVRSGLQELRSMIDRVIESPS